jgi:hypothetical protein
MNYIINNKLKFEKNKYNPIPNSVQPITTTVLTRNRTNMGLQHPPIEINTKFSDIPSSKSIDFKLKNYKINNSLLNQMNPINRINPINSNNQMNQIKNEKDKQVNIQEINSTNDNYYKTDEIIINIYGNSESRLNNKILYDFLLELSKNIKIKIYIHTWNVDKSAVEYYFQGLNIVSMIIDQPQISNNFEPIFSSNKSMSSWKMMWTGMFRSMNEIYKKEDNNIIILNTRFDINYKFNINDILKLSEDKFTKNIFLKDSTDLSGVDNPIIGDKHTLHRLINSFYNNLENVSMFYSSLTVPEASIYYENNRLFGVNYKDMFVNIEKYSIEKNSIEKNSIEK